MGLEEGEAGPHRAGAEAAPLVLRELTFSLGDEVKKRNNQ